MVATADSDDGVAVDGGEDWWYCYCLSGWLRQRLPAVCSGCCCYAVVKATVAVGGPLPGSLPLAAACCHLVVVAWCCGG